MDHDDALQLLRDTHDFPGPYTFRAVIRPGDDALVLRGVQDVLDEGDDITEVTARPSRKGSYVAVRITVAVASAEAVIRVNRALHAMEAVVLTM